MVLAIGELGLNLKSPVPVHGDPEKGYSKEQTKDIPVSFTGIQDDLEQPKNPLITKDDAGGFVNPLSFQPIFKDITKPEVEKNGDPAQPGDVSKNVDSEKNEKPQEKKPIQIGYLNVYPGIPYPPYFKWKALGILLVQVLAGIAIVAVCQTVHYSYFREHYVFSLTVIILAITLMCLIGRVFTSGTAACLVINIFLIIAMTLSESTLIGIYATQFDLEQQVIPAAVMTGVIIPFLMIYAFRMKSELTLYMAKLYPFHIILVLHWCFAFNSDYSESLLMVTSGIALLMSSIFILGSTQLISGSRALHCAVFPHSFIFAPARFFMWICAYFMFAITVSGRGNKFN